MFALLCIKVFKTIGSPLRSHKRNKSLYRRGVNFFLKENLLLTNSLTSGACMGIGDIIQQEIEYQSKLLSKRYNWERVARMCIVGTLVGPAHHFYYIYLDKLMPKTNVRTVFSKVACDQLIASPLTILFFFYAMGLLEKKSISQCNEEIIMKFKYVVMGDWLFWPPVQIVNFYFLPTHYRVLYINAATMIFNVFMSYMKHFDEHLGPVEVANSDSKSVEEPEHHKIPKTIWGEP